MTSSEFQRLPFDKAAIRAWKALDRRHRNWPTVYLIDGEGSASQPAVIKRGQRLTDVYVGETVNAAGRLLQHLDSPGKKHLTRVRVVLDDRFNKSACLDLEWD